MHDACARCWKNHVHLVACSSASVSTSVAAEKYKDDLVLAEKVGVWCLCLRAAVSSIPQYAGPRPAQLQRSHGATFIPVIGPRSPGSSHHWATPGKQPSNSQTSHYHNIHPIRLHTFTIKTDTFTDACIIIHKDQTSFDTLDSTLDK